MGERHETDQADQQHEVKDVSAPARPGAPQVGHDRSIVTVYAPPRWSSRGSARGPHEDPIGGRIALACACQRPSSRRASRSRRRASRAAAVRCLSPIMIAGAFVWPRTMRGMIDASATRSRSTPRTQRSGVTTAAASMPMRHVPTGQPCGQFQFGRGSRRACRTRRASAPRAPCRPGRPPTARRDIRIGAPSVRDDAAGRPVRRRRRSRTASPTCATNRCSRWRAKTGKDGRARSGSRRSRPDGSGRHSDRTPYRWCKACSASTITEAWPGRSGGAAS